MRKEKQFKSSQLKQLILESKTFVNEKFTKTIIGLLAARIKGAELTTKGNIENIHKIIEHVLNSAPSFQLTEYLKLGEELLGTKEE